MEAAPEGVAEGAPEAGLEAAGLPEGVVPPALAGKGSAKPTTCPSPGADCAVPKPETRMAKPVA